MSEQGHQYDVEYGESPQVQVVRDAECLVITEGFVFRTTPRHPVSTTHSADTEVESAESAVSTGVNESLCYLFAHQKYRIPEDVGSGYPSPSSEKPR